MYLLNPYKLSLALGPNFLYVGDKRTMLFV